MIGTREKLICLSVYVCKQYTRSQEKPLAETTCVYNIEGLLKQVNSQSQMKAHVK